MAGLLVLVVRMGEGRGEKGEGSTGVREYKVCEYEALHGLQAVGVLFAARCVRVRVESPPSISHKQHGERADYHANKKRMDHEATAKTPYQQPIRQATYKATNRDDIPV